MVFLSYLHFWQQPANPRNLLCTCNDFFWVESHQTSWSLSDLKNILGEPKAFQSFYLENSSHFNSLNHQANLKYPFPCTFLWPTQNISRTLLLKPTTIWGVSQKTRVVGSWKYFFTSFDGTWFDLDLEVSTQDITRRFRAGHRLGPHKAAKASVPQGPMPSPTIGISGRPWFQEFPSYCWWTKSCTTKDDNYPIIYGVLTIPGGAGFRPSTVWMASDPLGSSFLGRKFCKCLKPPPRF